jgi:hypothetical protein
MPRYTPTISETAQLVALLIQRYGQSRGKEVSRFRLSIRALRRIAGRPQMRDVAVDKWRAAMADEQGWLVFADGEEFLLIRRGFAKGWTKVGGKVIEDLLLRLASGDRGAVEDAAKELLPPPAVEAAVVEAAAAEAAPAKK